jgi:hypothetical protein
MAKKYWESVSEDHLLAVDLTTDDPEKLDNLTLTVPMDRKNRLWNTATT